MSQATDWDILTTPPATPTVQASRVSGSLNAILTQHSGSSRPSYALAGTVWLDIVSGTEWNEYLFDGTDDILRGTYNPTTNVFTPAGAAAADMLKADNLAGLASYPAARVNLGLDQGMIGYVIDGGGAVITTGLKVYLPPIPFACTINQWTLLGDVSGSIVVNIYKSTYAAYDPTTHPAVADKITASTPPTITTAKKNQSSTLTSWTTSIAAGDILALNVDSVTSLTKCTFGLKVTR